MTFILTSAYRVIAQTLSCNCSSFVFSATVAITREISFSLLEIVHFCLESPCVLGECGLAPVFGGNGQFIVALCLLLHLISDSHRIEPTFCLRHQAVTSATAQDRILYPRITAAVDTLKLGWDIN